MYTTICVTYFYQILDKRVDEKYKRYVFTAISNILNRNKEICFEKSKVFDEIEYVYNTLCHKHRSVQKAYPSINNVMDEMHSTINTKANSHVFIKENREIVETNYEYFMEIYVYFKNKYPYYNLEKDQQELLVQLKDNNNVNEILLKELSSDFYRSNKEILKNNKNTFISYVIGITGIVLTVLSFFK